jgi:hypothetical protein
VDSLRQRWRALTLTLKAKLEAVECRIETFESAFLPYMVLPSGKTIGEEIIPRLPEITASGNLALPLL